MADLQQPQSSFIPKKSASGGGFGGHSGSLISFVANLIFVITIISAVAVFGYSKYLGGQIASMSSALDEARQSLQPNLIRELSQADKRLESARDLINNHITLSSLFEMLQTSTLQQLRFTSFTWNVDTSGKYEVHLDGAARSYSAVALQAKIFNDSPDFIDPRFSDLDLNDKGEVTFKMRSGISPRLVSYVEQFKNTPTTPVVPFENQTSSATTTPAATSTP